MRDEPTQCTRCLFVFKEGECCPNCAKGGIEVVINFPDGKDLTFTLNDFISKTVTDRQGTARISQYKSLCS